MNSISILIITAIEYLRTLYSILLQIIVLSSTIMNYIFAES